MLGVGQSIFDIFYPIGSYYETSDTNFNPNTANSWYGTWVEDTEGQVLVSRNSGTFATVEANVGEEKHKLTVPELPKHKPTIKWGIYTPSYNSGGNNLRIPWSDFNGNNTELLNASEIGNDQAHNNIQPSKVIIRWHRTA